MMPRMKNLLAVVFCGAAAVGLAAQSRSTARPANNPDQKEWIQLFNGRNLDGWTPKFAHHDLG